MPLRIVIVGAGIAGLCAAVALRHAGHSVQIIEKSQFASEIGAALAIAPNGARVLSSLGFCFKRTRAWNLPCWESVDGRTLRSLFHMDLTDCPTRFGEGFMAIHRVDLHNELLKLALEGTDNPALLRLGITAEDVDAIDGSLFLSDGTKCQADLIVGADGTHSAIRHSVLKLMDQPTMTDMSAFRFLVPTDRIENEGSLSDLYKWKSSGTTIFVDTSDKAVERHLVWYPCRGGEIQNVVGIHPTRSHSGIETDLKAALLNEFRNFQPDILKLLELAEEVKCWQLANYEPFPTWLSGKTVLIGDAAHPMLPFGGQAANQAIEDGGALGVLLSAVNNDAEMLERLRIFENLKKNRTSIVQILSSVRIGRENEVEQKLQPFAQTVSEVPKTFFERVEYAFSFDIIQKCRETLNTIVDKAEKNNPF